MPGSAAAKLPEVDATAISSAVAALEPYMVETLTEFVATESLLGNERSAAEFMEKALSELGLQSERIYLNTDSLKDLPLYSPACCPDGGRYNLLATHRPKSNTGRSVLFNGHLDVVPTGPYELWKTHPFKSEVQDGWLYGRGAGDMKAGIICALAAFKALRSLGVQPAANVGFNGVLEEENTGNGTLASVSALRGAINAAKLTAYDAVLIPEPVQETMQEAQVGVLWMYVDVIGRPAHAAYMNTGVNPVEIALDVVASLKALEAEWNLPENRYGGFKDHDHPINFNLGQIHAGDWNSSIPSVCTLGLRLSFYPNMTIEDVKRCVEERIRAVEKGISQSDVKIDVRYEGFNAPGCEFDLNSTAMRLLADTHKSVSGEEVRKRWGTGTTDARHFRMLLDVPVTCYGPKARNVHAFDECVSIESMVRVATVFALFMHEWCGLERVTD